MADFKTKMHRVRFPLWLHRRPGCREGEAMATGTEIVTDLFDAVITFIK